MVILNEDKSLGETIFNSLKSLPQANEWQVNGITGESNTLGEVLSSAVQVARSLDRLNLGVADVVAIVSDYNHNCFAVVYGSLFNGSAPFPIPMNDTLKQRELEHAFKLSKPKAVFVVEKKVAEATAALDVLGNPAPVFVLTGKVPEGSRAHPFECLLDSSADVETYTCRSIPGPSTTVAAVVSSSGTTGMPKGVALSHTSCLIRMKYFAEYEYPYVRGANFMQTTPLFWISGFLCTLWSALLGFKKVYFNDLSPEIIILAFENYQVGWCMFAPVFIDRLMRSPLLDKFDLSSWKHVAIGGSPLPSSTAQLLKERLPHVTATQGYGASEVAGPMTNCFYTTDIMSAGKAMSYITVKIVNIETNEEVSPGETGEITLKSNTTMITYLLNEENTKSPIDEDGFYHTGDLGYMNSDGFLYITGRNKDLMKVKIWRVVPMELENVIGHLKGVLDVAVVGVPHPVDTFHPRALVVKESDADLSEEQIINEVAEKLSETKQLLGGAQFVSSIPRNASGKIIRGQLLKLVHR